MPQALVDELLAYVRSNHPRSLTGIEEALALQPGRGPLLTGKFLAWLKTSQGAQAIPRAVDAYVRFTTDVNLHQARFNITGDYQNKSFDEVYRQHYSQDETMADYLLGVYLTNTLWGHHLELSLFYHDRFLKRLSPGSRLVEIAPGHGGWGVWALDTVDQSTLQGFDISPASITLANSIATAAGVAGRAVYRERNALDLEQLEAQDADACICCFLLEHLEQPHKLLEVIHHLLKPGGVGFVTGALTAAQVDHIYRFDRESELVVLCEAAGLRVLETLSCHPQRNLPKARFLPRSMGLLVQRPQHASG